MYIAFRYNAIAHLIDYGVNITFICTRKPKKFPWLTFFVTFAFLQWSRIEPKISPRNACTSILVTDIDSTLSLFLSKPVYRNSQN